MRNMRIIIIVLLMAVISAFRQPIQMNMGNKIAATIIGTGLVFMPCSSFAATIPPKDPSLSTPVVIEKKAKYSIGAGAGIKNHFVDLDKKSKFYIGAGIQ